MSAFGLAVVAVLVAACGSSGESAHTPTASARSEALAYSQCMRSHGVANFPDPNADGQVKIASSSGINFYSPAFEAAESACQKLAGGGQSASGPSSAQTMSKFLAFSKCIRAHGVAGFPDPTTSPPPNAPGHTVSSHGVYLFIPITTDVNSPTFRSASAACGFHRR